MGGFTFEGAKVECIFFFLVGFGFVSCVVEVYFIVARKNGAES